MTDMLLMKPHSCIQLTMSSQHTRVTFEKQRKDEWTRLHSPFSCIMRFVFG